MSSVAPWGRVLAVGAVSFFAIGRSAMAEDAPSNTSPAEEVIVTGTRETTQTQFTALSPIDVFSAEKITSTGSNHLDEAIATLVPSFQVKRLPASDGGQFVKPATLNGLSPDMTLLLLNGKRVHRSAYLQGNGAQAADMGQIPTAAIGHVEVLRDGASAQYGSDAIAGVVNVMLDNKPGFNFFSQGSQFYAGDGAAGQAGGRAGFALDNGGHLTVSTELSKSEPTSRSHQRADAIAFQNANPSVAVANPVQRWGNPDDKEIKSAIDFAQPVNDFAEAYAFGTFGSGKGISDINWRNPATNPTIFGNSASQKIFPGYSLTSRYPGGFTPREAINYTDGQGTIGLRDNTGDDLTWDVSTSWGTNDSQFLLYNSINASLGPMSPTDFNLGHQVQTEFNLNADSVYLLHLKELPDPVNVAFGTERRKETYQIVAGDAASYAVGPGAVVGMPAEANGFPGFSSQQAGTWGQVSYAGYLDVTVPLTKAWNVEMAGRDENYEEFGNTFNYKLASRYELTREFALRGSYSTGFKAPTPGELNSTSTSQGLDTKTLQLYTAGRLSPLNPVAQYFGAKPLKPEESSTYTTGAAWHLDSGLSGSVDVYQTDISKRFSLSSTHVITAAEQAQLIALGVPGASSINQINYYTNDFDTQTRGVDLVGSYGFDAGPGRTDLTAAYSYTFTTVTGGSLAASSDKTQKILFEQGTPRHNASVSSTYTLGPVSLMTRMRYYGAWTDSTGSASGTSTFQRFGGVPFFDAAVTYNFDEHALVRLGAENFLDTYPEKAAYQTSRGLVYSRNTPYDTNGGLYYLRLEVKY
ncbi:TonB-dependent receptor [Telmatospirillum sp.]|uniref:TonB-dependent receptor plug domain-containing protein n=1 Tax=Telmatospirillum sp. TaxID=2079197 RepID=UPI00284E0C42|nr:TonB-dependent receptor [Telmatospirillum sp.]MDR3441019.1 TonB-dependent receptor [Telmatospirillum sp.]